MRKRSSRNFKDSDSDLEQKHCQEDELNLGVSDEEVERAQDRLKEAKKYLTDLRNDAKKSKNSSENLLFGEIDDAEEIDKEIISSRLQRDTLISRGRAFENLAESYKGEGEILKIHFNTPDGRVPTGCVISSDSRLIYFITKGNCVYQYALGNREGGNQDISVKKLHTFKGIGQASDIDSFTSISLSFCGKYLIAGSRSGKIVVWYINSTKSYKQLDVLTQHRGSVLSLAFSRDDLTFYSASADRTVKIWSLESGEALYIDTLYGHQDIVPSLGALGRETCVTVGSRDRTARLWKISEETQLVFRGPEITGGSQDIITIIEEGAFLTGTDLGAISLWNTRKKKPLSTIQVAHEGKKPIGALSALPFTDLAASGSGDGYLRLWRAAPYSNDLSCIRSIPLHGFINSISWSEDGKLLIAAVGREPRLGRWETDKSAKNQLHIFNFKK